MGRAEAQPSCKSPRWVSELSLQRAHSRRRSAGARRADDGGPGFSCIPSSWQRPADSGLGSRAEAGPGSGWGRALCNRERGRVPWPQDPRAGSWPPQAGEGEEASLLRRRLRPHHGNPLLCALPGSSCQRQQSTFYSRSRGPVHLQLMGEASLRKEHRVPGLGSPWATVPRPHQPVGWELSRALAPVPNWGPTLGGHQQGVGDTRPCLPCVSPPSRAAAAVIRAGGKGRTLVAMGVPLSPLRRPRRGHGGGSPAWFEDCDLQVPWGGGRGGLCSSARICWEVDPGSWILASLYLPGSCAAEMR